MRTRLNKWWWALKVGIFPHLERRRHNLQAAEERRKVLTSRMTMADEMLSTAIMDLSAALQHIGDKDKK